jgi:hypothetical protein
MKTELQLLNDLIRQNEKEANVDFFKKHLSDDMIFKRVDGSIATKQDYINGLGGRTWNKLENHSVEIFCDEQQPNVAIVVIEVAYDFINAKGENKQGIAKNIRYFRKNGDLWQLYMWYNEKI